MLEIGAVRRRRLHGLVPDRELARVRAPAVRGHRQQVRRLRAARAGHRGHAARACATRSTSRATATCCSWPPSRRSGRTSARASAGSTCSSAGPARSTPTTRAATASCRPSCARSSRRRRSRRVDRGSATSRTSRSRRSTRRRRSPTTRSSRTASRGTRTSKHGADMLPFPVKFLGEELPEPGMAPTRGRAHRRSVLGDVLGYDAERIAALRKAGAFGRRPDLPKLRTSRPKPPTKTHQSALATPVKRPRVQAETARMRNAVLADRADRILSRLFPTRFRAGRARRPPRPRRRAAPLADAARVPDRLPPAHGPREAAPACSTSAAARCAAGCR